MAVLLGLQTHAFKREKALQSLPCLTMLNSLRTVAPLTNVPGVNICTNGNVQEYFFYFWLPALLFETMLVVAVIYLALEPNHRQAGFKRGQLTRIIIRDNVLYFLM